jgi:hypothetical protein
MSDLAVDEVSLTKTVMFVGDYFTMMTTVVLDEGLRYEGEDDDEFAMRIATVFLSEYYGFDDLDEKATVSIGIVVEE